MWAHYNGCLANICEMLWMQNVLDKSLFFLNSAFWGDYKQILGVFFQSYAVKTNSLLVYIYS